MRLPRHRGCIPLLKRVLVRRAIGVLCLLSLSACTRDRPPNIVVVLADALRADRVGCYGAGSKVTPFLDALASRSVVFHNAYAQAPWTNPSIATLFTSRFSSQHGIISFGSVLADKEVTLAEILQRHGYTTAGFSAHGLYGRRLGFDQGFDTFRVRVRKHQRRKLHPFVPAKSINRDIASWLDDLSPRQRSGPIFLFVHYMETHEPYTPPPAVLQRVFEGEGLPNLRRLNGLFFAGFKHPIRGTALHRVKRLYDAGVLSLDEGVRDLFGKLEQREFLDNALVVVTADHGQELMDHGSMGHGRTLYEEVIRVPLLVSVPGLHGGAVANEVVGTIDIAPTILDWIGEGRPQTFEGRSLCAVLRRTARGRQADAVGAADKRAPPAFSELISPPRGQPPKEHYVPRAAVVSQHEKLIEKGNVPQGFYDLASDPSETNPDALNPAERVSLLHQLEEFRKRVARRVAPRRTEDLDADTRERMRALGYAE